MTHIKLPYIRLRPTRFPFVKILTSELSLLPLNANSHASGSLRTLTPPPFLAFVYQSLSKRAFSAALRHAQAPRLERTASKHSLAQTHSLLLFSFTSKQTEQLSSHLLPMSRPRRLLVSQPTQCGCGPISLAPILLRPAAPRTCNQLGPAVTKSCLTCPLSSTWCCRPLLVLGLGRSPLLVFFLLSGLCIPASHEGSSSSNCPA